MTPPPLLRIDAHTCELLRAACHSRAEQLRRLGNTHQAAELDHLAQHFHMTARHHDALSCPGCQESGRSPRVAG